MWILLIVALTGTFTTEATFHSIQFTNKDACVRAAKDAANSSSYHMGYLCISSETGESLKFQKKE